MAHGKSKELAQIERDPIVKVLVLAYQGTIFRVYNGSIVSTDKTRTRYRIAK